MENLKNILWLCLAGLLLAALPAVAGQIVVSTPSFALVFDAPVGGELRYLYYGTGLSEDDLRQMNVAGTCHHVAYPSYGIGWPGESALRVRHADGVIATNPTTAPMAAPIADGLRPRRQSNTTQVIMAMADAVLVLRKARTAIESAANEEPALNPNQPNQSMAAPNKTKGTLAGS